MKLKVKIQEWREIMTAAAEYHDTAETVNPRKMLELLDFTAKAIAALQFYEQHEKKLDGGHAAREVLALLEKDV